MNLTTTQYEINKMSKQHAINYLLKLANKEITPKHGEGICEELQNEFNIPIGKLVKYFKTWEHFSGNLSYPVPHSDFDHPGYAFYDKDRCLWGDHEYGNLRRDLCKHIATEMQKNLH